MISKTLLILSILNMAFIMKLQVNYRELLIFGEADNKALVDNQLKILQQHMDGLKERFIKIVVVKKESNLYKKYQIKQGNFTVILIGKDTTEKYRSNTIIDIVQLFATIDAMPMRKEEIKKKG